MWGVVLFILASIFGIIISIAYLNARWKSKSRIWELYEKVRAAEADLQPALEKCKGMVQRCQEILMLSESRREEEARKLLLESPIAVDGRGYVLANVLKTIDKCYDDVLYSIEVLNERIAEFNSYIKNPVIPSIVAKDLKLSEFAYETEERLKDVIDKKLMDIKMLEEDLRKFNEAITRQF